MPLTSVPPAAVALDSMLQEIAELNEAEVNAAVARTLLLLESIMIVLLRVIRDISPDSRSDKMGGQMIVRLRHRRCHASVGRRRSVFR